MKTRVYMLYTGGTIGMAPQDALDPTSPLAPQPFSDVLRFLPAFFGPAKQSNILTLDNGNLIELGYDSLEPVDSADISPQHWVQIAQKIQAVYADYDGFIVLHGTDTMAYTSSALSFMFENLGKPIVLTGSQYPITAIRTDAVVNVSNAIYVAGYQATLLPLIPEVVIVFADKILRGCRATKVSSCDRAGFDSPNFPPLGTIGEHIMINTRYLLPRPECKHFSTKTDLVTRVFSISLFPGFPASPMRQLLLNREIEGIVLHTYGAGNVPTNADFLTMVRQSVQGNAPTSLTGDIQPQMFSGGRLIVAISQCAQVAVDMGLYAASCGIL